MMLAVQGREADMCVMESVWSPCKPLPVSLCVLEEVPSLHTQR